MPIKFCLGIFGVLIAILTAIGLYCLFQKEIVEIDATTNDNYRNDNVSFEETVKNEISMLISDHKVMVFSKSYCPYCRRAKATISKYIKNFKVIEMDQEMEPKKMKTYQTYLKQITGASTVPRIFIDGKFIGGSDDIIDLDNRGKLKPMLVNI